MRAKKDVMQNLVQFKKTVGAYQELKKMFDLEKQRVLKPLRQALFEDFQVFFKNNPDFVKVAWNQYTPYFNDGEPCVFRVEGLIAYDEDDEESYEPDGAPEIDNVDVDLMRDLFGESVRVTLKRGGEDFIVEYCEHD